ncbi:MAG: hypothetical protein JSV56_13480 [Methanomassiliicoccales archaeon]|nr:MAG: hypothetical protein JSV56_13480 [Methanomassiliicoccales archaeon]
MLNVSSTGRRHLYHYLTLYRTCPAIVQTVPAQLGISPEKFAEDEVKGEVVIVEEKK